MNNLIKKGDPILIKKVLWEEATVDLVLETGEVYVKDQYNVIRGPVKPENIALINQQPPTQAKVREEDWDSLVATANQHPIEDEKDAPFKNMVAVSEKLNQPPYAWTDEDVAFEDQDLSIKPMPKRGPTKKVVVPDFTNPQVVNNKSKRMHEGSGIKKVLDYLQKFPNRAYPRLTLCKHAKVKTTVTFSIHKYPSVARTYVKGLMYFHWNNGVPIERKTLAPLPKVD